MAINSTYRTLTANNIEGVVAPKNYVNNGLEVNSTDPTIAGWHKFTTTLSSSPALPNGTPTIDSAASISTFAITADGNSLNLYNKTLQVGSSIGFVAGQGIITDAFTIDRADLGKVLTIKFSYENITGPSNFSGILGSQTFAIYIYDVTASAWVQPAGFLGMNQSSGAGVVTATFQTSVVSGQQYRLAIVALQATLGTTTLTFDNFTVSTQTAPLGAAVTDFVDKGTTTVGAVTTAPTKGTVAIDKVLMRRVGDCAALIYEYSQTAAGSAGSGTYLFSLPAGMSFDTTKIATVSTSANNRNAGTLIGYGSSGADPTLGYSANLNAYAVNSTQFIAVQTSAQQTSGTVDPGVDEPIGSANLNFGYAQYAIKLYITAPIAGWSSNVQVSSDTDTRVVDFAGSQTTQAVTANVTNISFTTIKDSHGAWSTSQYAIPVSGDYLLSGSFIASLAGTAGDVYKNGVRIGAYLGASAYVAGAASGGSALITGCNAGDLITVRSTQTATITSGYLSIHRLSGPSVIAATETVAASYYCSATASASATVPVNFDAKEFDTHNAVTTSSTAWKFTAPVSGTYHVTLVANLSGTATWINIFKTGSLYKGLSYGGSTSNAFGSTVLKLNAGDYIDIRTVSAMNFTGGALNTDISNLTIVRVGN